MVDLYGEDASGQAIVVAASCAQAGDARLAALWRDVGGQVDALSAISVESDF
ncbi:hypothetical protein ROR02_12710 [Pararhodospirillum oryzae]|uniref:Uncharacterized protein n=2 Tax=Pararhodospirillum oryzae TaxID=478448 RepID=A0A512H6X7_9PROT|nr:hypothetical protein ROR02_12710 [Pararhodospirillum oryzae]